jgi:hypothetical protein
LSESANPHGYWVFWMKNILIFFDLPLDSVHASMVLYTQDVRENKIKKTKTTTPGPERRAEDPEETTAERGASLGEKQKKEGSGSNSPPDKP